MSDVLGQGRKQSKKAQRQQENLIKQQKQLETARLAESQDEVARRRQTAKGRTGGRSLLVQTSPTGAQSTTLGG